MCDDLKIWSVGGVDVPEPWQASLFPALASPIWKPSELPPSPQNYREKKSTPTRRNATLSQHKILQKLYTSRSGGKRWIIHPAPKHKRRRDRSLTALTKKHPRMMEMLERMIDVTTSGSCSCKMIFINNNNNPPNREQEQCQDNPRSLQLLCSTHQNYQIHPLHLPHAPSFLSSALSSFHVSSVSPYPTLTSNTSKEPWKTPPSSNPSPL